MVLWENVEPSSRHRILLAVLLVTLLFFQAILTLLPEKLYSPRPAYGQMPVTIDFENLSSTSRLLNIQYADKGITFNNLNIMDYSLSHGPGFAHSGSKGIETCAGIEFCTVPMEIRFTTEQSYVRVWVGLSFSLPEGDLPVSMRVYNNAGMEIGHSITTFHPSGSPQNIAVPLEFISNNANIASVTVGPQDSSRTSSGIALDDLEFSTAGPPPECNAVPPVVFLFKPPASQVQNTQVNKFLLEGIVSTSAPLVNATLTITDGGSTKSSNLLSTLISPNGGTFYPIWISDSLFEGSNTVTVKVANCAGMSEDSRTVVYAPIALDAHFVFHGIEVTQSIQDMDNSVPLIAGKKTFARVYLQAEGIANQINDVTGTLWAFRQDSSGNNLPVPFNANAAGGPHYTLHSIGNAISLDNSTDLLAKRESLTQTINFELPWEWTVEGKVQFVFRPLISDETSTVPCEDPDLQMWSSLGCDDFIFTSDFRFPTANLLSEKWYTFQKAPSIHIELLNIPYKQNGVLVWEDQADIDAGWSYMRRAFPTQWVAINQFTLIDSPFDDGEPDCGDVNSWLYALYIYDWSYSGDIYSGPQIYGAYRETEWSCSPGYGFVASGDAGSMPHELIHNFGYDHIGFEDSGGACIPGPQDGSGIDEDFPHPEGSIGEPNVWSGPYGFDWRENSNSPRVLSPTAHHDIMSYCSSKWLSDYTYRNVLRVTCDQQPSACGVTTYGTKIVDGSDIMSPLNPLPRAAMAQPVGQDFLLIRGTMETDGGPVHLDPFVRSTDFRPTARPSEAPYAINLYGEGGETLATYPFNPKFFKNSQSNSSLIGEVIPFTPGTTLITITKEGRELT